LDFKFEIPIFAENLRKLRFQIMILQFKAKNILSIRDEQTLDFTASADNTYEEYAVVKIKNVRISKLGVIYGPNASGKSNILKALFWLFKFMTNEDLRKQSLGTGLIPFKMDKNSRNEHSFMSIIFYIDDSRYEYSIELDTERVYHEEMYYYPNSRKALVYERTWNQDKMSSAVTFGPLLKLTATQKLFIESNCVANATVLSTYQNSNVDRNDMLDTILRYMKVQILASLDSNTDIVSFANDIVKVVQESKPFIREMLVQADFNITDLYLKKKEKNERTITVTKKMDSEELVLEADAQEDLFFTHQTPFYTGDMNNAEESEGTLRMYCLSAIMYLLIKQNQILLSDEMENSLHYDLLTHIIKTFLVNSERGQLIFSTHSLMLLDEEFIRRDMVYFTNKNEAGATEIYRAKDFGLHKEVSILNAYRAGKLGAKPNLGSIFTNIAE
jgi:AAA15 family ATPase/GTPase